MEYDSIVLRWNSHTLLENANKVGDTTMFLQFTHFLILTTPHIQLRELWLRFHEKIQPGLRFPSSIATTMKFKYHQNCPWLLFVYYSWWIMLPWQRRSKGGSTGRTAHRLSDSPPGLSPELHTSHTCPVSIRTCP